MGRGRLPARGGGGRPELRVGRAGRRPARRRAGPHRQLPRERPRRLLRRAHQRRLDAAHPRVRPRRVGTTVIGGNVYRGRPPSAVWTGSYAFADFGSGRVWRAFRDGGGDLADAGDVHRHPVDHELRRGRPRQPVLHPHRGHAAPDRPLHVRRRARRRTPSGASSSACTRRASPAAAAGTTTARPSPTTREQMAVFVLRAGPHARYPPPCGAPMFSDVPASSPFCRWIEELARGGRWSRAAAAAPTARRAA